MKFLFRWTIGSCTAEGFDMLKGYVIVDKTLVFAGNIDKTISVISEKI